MKKKPIEPFYLRLGRVLCEARRRKGMSQRAVADVLGFDVSTITLYERGVNRLRTLEFVQLCDVLGLDPGEALREMREETPELVVPRQRQSISSMRRREASGGRRRAD